MTILEEAQAIVNGDRQEDYGNPEESLTRIAEYWSVYLRGKLQPNADIEPRDVALMMSLLKIAREGGGRHKRDNLIDAAGYFEIASRVQPDG